MKMRSFVSTVLAGIGLSLLGASCDWTGGGDAAFNTSGGSVAINISGNYRGILSGGRAVSQTSGGTISSLTLQQSGNAVEVVDSNGHKYRGTVGSPLSLASPDEDGVLAAGAQLANFQVSWEGTDFAAGKKVSFSGIIGVVTVNDIQGDSTTRTIDSSESEGTTTSNNSTVESVNLQSEENERTDNTFQTVFGPNGNPIQEGTATEINSNQFDTVSTTLVNDSTSSTANSDNTGRTITSTFQVNGNNAQYRLKGSWIENGGVVATVDAISAAAGGVIQTVATAAAN
jgi:hypothetical protein